MKRCTSLTGSREKYVYTELYKGGDKRIIIWARRGVWELGEGLCPDVSKEKYLAKHECGGKGTTFWREEIRSTRCKNKNDSESNCRSINPGRKEGYVVEC
jgi:hypothetical protein